MAIPRMGRDGRAPGRPVRAFTLIEILVVVGILALLMAILLPSLANARNEAKAVGCATNLNHVGKAVSLYLTRFRVFPVSYAYTDAKGNWDFQSQPVQPTNGYMHWSYMLYDEGKVDDKAFQCPNYDNGGAPRTNPGNEGSDWESGQVDENGQTSPNTLEDHQARRMSYTANAAIIPRNKFRRDMVEGGGQRTNKLVNESSVKGTGKVVLATEFNNSWQAIGVQSQGGILSKSHRPINPFYSVASGYNEYAASATASTFVYDPETGNPGTYGLLPKSEVVGVPGLIEGARGGELNAVGRHHPGGDKEYGGTANFLYCDGHVERKTVMETMKRRDWGEKYYSLSGPNDILKGKPRRGS